MALDDYVLIDKQATSDIVIVTFGGLISNDKMGKPVFEFRRMLTPLGHSVIYVRDYYQSRYHKCCYHVGWQRPGPSIQEMIHILKKHITNCNPKKVIFLGNSAGGYAALLFGLYLQPDEVHAFVPQTFLSISKKKKYHDHRYMALHRKVLIMDILYPSQWKHRDLAKSFATTKNTKTQFHIRYGSQYPLDKIHAQQLAGYPNVHLQEYPNASHHMIKELKATGELMDIIQQATTIS